MSFGSFALYALLQVDVHKWNRGQRVFLSLAPEVDLREVWSATVGIGVRL